MARKVTCERPDFAPVTSTTRIRAYARRSYPGEDEKTYSMDAQRHDLEAWAAKQGVSVEHFYNDPGGKSKADTLARPVLMQAMDDARRGEFDKLVVWKYDRFSRDQNLGGQAVFQFEARYGVEVISYLEPVPPGPMATMMRRLYFFAAETEHTGITARFFGGRVQRVSSGSLPGAPFSLYGLAHADRGDGSGRGERKATYVGDWADIDGDPDHIPARVSQRMYHMALEGGTNRSIAVALTREQVPTPCIVHQARGTWPAGKRCSSTWSAGTVGRILENPAYRGVYEAWRSTVVIEQQRNSLSGEMEDVVRVVRRQADDESIVRLEGVILEQLVDDATWFAVQERRVANKRDSARNAVDPEGALLKHGVAVCGYCGRNIVASWQKQRGKYLYSCADGKAGVAWREHRCTGGGYTWPAPETDKLVWDWVLAQFAQPNVMRAKYQEWQRDRQSGRVLEVDRRETLHELLAAALDERDNLMDLAGKTRDPSMRARYAHLAEQANDQAKGYEADLGAVEATLASAERTEAAVEDIVAKGQAALEQLRTAEYGSKRALLYTFNVQVKLWRQGTVNAAGEPDALEISWMLDAGKRGERAWSRVAGGVNRGVTPPNRTA